jgi:hypothetical protein
MSRFGQAASVCGRFVYVGVCQQSGQPFWHGMVGWIVAGFMACKDERWELL